MHFEKGDFEACIKDCEAAVDRGRELRADYKMISKALTRKANALRKLNRLEEAVQIYNKALTEHRYYPLYLWLLAVGFFCVLGVSSRGRKVLSKFSQQSHGASLAQVVCLCTSLYLSE